MTQKEVRARNKQDCARPPPAADATASTGSVGTADSVAVAGSVDTAGSAAVAGSVDTAGSVAVAGGARTARSIGVVQSAATAGSVAVAGSVATAGSVAVAASAATAGSVAIRPPVGDLPQLSSAGAYVGVSASFGKAKPKMPKMRRQRDGCGRPMMVARPLRSRSRLRIQAEFSAGAFAEDVGDFGAGVVCPGELDLGLERFGEARCGLGGR